MQKSQVGDGKSHFLWEKTELFGIVIGCASARQSRRLAVAGATRFLFSPNLPALIEPKGWTAHDSYSVRRGQITARVQYWTRIDQITSWSIRDPLTDLPQPGERSPYPIWTCVKIVKVPESPWKSHGFWRDVLNRVRLIRLQNPRYSSNVASDWRSP